MPTSPVRRAISRRRRASSCCTIRSSARSSGVCARAETAMPKHVPERTCILTRTAGSAEELMRFVRDPEGNVVADLRHRLPGR
ncbi:YlxR family protein, partial [Bacillus cereus]